MEKSPGDLQVVTDDEDCVKMLRVMLPLLEYRVERVEETRGSYVVYIRKKRQR